MATLWSPDIKNYPERFALLNYPWGRENTPLANMKGPRSWQMEALEEYGENIRNNKKLAAFGEDMQTWKDATVSGRGIGKTAMFGILSNFHASCWPGSTTIVAANGEPQLTNKTLPEMRKWFTMGLNSHWFDVAAMSIKPQAWLKDILEKQLKVDCGYYYVQGQLWTEESPDAFAGAHNPLGLVVLMDEASGIPTPIWTVTQGFFTEPCPTRAHFAISNGRRNTGAFFECFHRNRAFWNTRQIDSRKVEGVDKAELEEIIATFGIDSDEARTEVLGEFPHTGSAQFIGNKLASEAGLREVACHLDDALVIGVDVARFGDDTTYIMPRKGLDARTHEKVSLKKKDTMEVAAQVADMYDNLNADAIFVDAGGVGAGVVDRLAMLGYPVVGVDFGSKADRNLPQSHGAKYANKRAEMWGVMKEWLKTGGIPNDPILISDLTGPEYKHNVHNAIILERKEDMKSRGLASPDWADALALTFAYPAAPRPDAGRAAQQGNPKVLSDYDPFNNPPV